MRWFERIAKKMGFKVILHHLLNVFVQLANKRGFKQKNVFFAALTFFT
jgi:hypothetical protein